jgi:hypothetical protein
MAIRSYPQVDHAGNILPDRHQESLTPLQVLFAEALAKASVKNTKAVDLYVVAKSVSMSKETMLRSFMDRRFCEVVEEKYQEPIDFALRAAVEASERFTALPGKKSADRTLLSRLDHTIVELTQAKNKTLIQRFPELRTLMPASFLRRYQ